MKKLSKLLINSERIINDKELQTLKGGDGPCCVCIQPGTHIVMGYLAAYDQSSCDTYCGELGWDGTWGNWTYC